MSQLKIIVIRIIVLFSQNMLPRSQKYGSGIPDPWVKKAVGSRIRNTALVIHIKKKPTRPCWLRACMGTVESPKRDINLRQLTQTTNFKWKKFATYGTGYCILKR